MAVSNQCRGLFNAYCCTFKIICLATGRACANKVLFTVKI